MLAARRDGTPTAWDWRLPDTLTWVALAGGIAWAIYFLVAAKGVEGADPIGHFVISREAWHRPDLMLHHWGRPVNTAVYMPAALFGLTAARLTSLVLAVLTALVTLRLAHRLQVQPAFVVMLLFWFQPWTARWVVHPALTEIPFTLLMVLCAYLFVSGRLLTASLVVGFLPLARVEAIALTGLWAAYCLWRREWRAAALAVLPIIVYAGLHRWVFGHLPAGRYPIVPTFSPGEHLLVPRGAPRPDWWRFVYQLLSGIGLPAAILALYGVPLVVRSPSRLAAFGWYASYLAVHMGAFGIGMLAALGGDQIRYLFPLAPAVSIVGTLGLQTFVGQMGASLDELVGRRDQARRLGWLIMAACLVLVLAAGVRQKPARIDEEVVAVKDTVDWLRQQGLADGPLVATHVVVHYFLPGHLRPVGPGVRSDALWTEVPPLAAMPVGTVVVWDSHFSRSFGFGHEALLADPSRWKYLQTFAWDVEGYLEIYRKERP